MTPLQESLKKCRVEGDTLFLPEQFLENYKEVRTALVKAGAAYKRNTFVFPSDAQPYIDKLMNGTTDLRKEFQFFETPDTIADYLVKLAQIREGQCVLEPHAGHGAIIAAIYRAFPYYPKGANDKAGVTVDYYELMDLNEDVLGKKINADRRWSSSTSRMGSDFLQANADNEYERIIANPPFSNNQDIDHIYKMYDCLKKGGRLVTVASTHYRNCSRKKETEFSKWLDSVNAYVEDLPSGAFKDSGTSISALIIRIDKV